MVGARCLCDGGPINTGVAYRSGEWVVHRVHGYLDGRMDGWMDGQMDFYEIPLG